MTGNEAGDRVHNFFEQDSLSLDQHHAQLVEGNWPVYNNNLWWGSERHIGRPQNSHSKNYSAQQSDIESGPGNEFSVVPHGLSFTESNLRPQSVKSPSQQQQLNLNGFMNASQVVHARQTEANFLRVETERDRDALTSCGLSLESQQSGSRHTNLSTYGGSESPMNFTFLGGQQQMNGQQPGMLQSLPRQQSAMNDAQLLQQQLMLKQMQELQRRQQLQQFEAMQRSAVNQTSTFLNQIAGQHSPAFINCNPVHDGSNSSWLPQVMGGNLNWPQCGVSSAVQGYSNGLMITPEQGQALRFMGLVTQQAFQSLYGVPIAGSQSANPFSQKNVDKPGVLQVPAQNSAFPSEYASLPDQVSMQGETTVSRSGSYGKNSFGHAQHLGNVVDIGIVNQVQQRNVLISEGGRQELCDGSESFPEKSVSHSASSQAAVALDPTEEKILFGNAESIWEAFGGAPLTGSGGCNRSDNTDVFNSFPSMQLGTWSALMQSAVAETSSSDVGLQERSGLGAQKSRSQTVNHQHPLFHDNEKEPVWVDSSERAFLGCRTNPKRSNLSSNVVNLDNNYLGGSWLQQPFPKQAREDLQTACQMPEEGKKWSDSNHPKPDAEDDQALENANSSRDCSKIDTGFWVHHHGKSGRPSSRSSALNFIEAIPTNTVIQSSNEDNLHDNDCDRHMSVDTGHGGGMRLEPIPNCIKMVGNSKDGAAAPIFSSTEASHVLSQKLPDDNHLDFWKTVNSSVNCGGEASGKDQHNSKKGPPVLESSVNIPNGGAVDIYETENCDGRENSNDSHRSNFTHHVPASHFKENAWSDDGDPHNSLGGKEKSSCQADKRMHVTRKFQYHPMGDLDTDHESSCGAKKVLHLNSISQHLPSGLKGHQAHAGFLDPSSTNSTDMEKGSLSSFQGGMRILHGVSSSGTHPGYSPNTAAPFVRSGELSSPNHHASSSQNMLELLHKVDQSKEQNAVSHLSSTEYSRSSELASGGHVGFNHSQSSASHGFSLQLAPPYQGVAASNVNVALGSSSRSVGSPSSGHMAFDKVDKAHAWSASVSSAQWSLPSHQTPQIELGNNRTGVLGNMDADGALKKGNLSEPPECGSPYLRNAPQNHHLIAAGGKMASNQSATVSFDRQAYHDQKRSNFEDQALASQSEHVSSFIDVSNLHMHNNLASGTGMNQFITRASTRQMPVPQSAVMPGMSRKENLSPLGANVWTTQQQLLGSQSCSSSDLQKSIFQANDTLEMRSLTGQKEDDQDSPIRVVPSSSQEMVGWPEPPVAEARSPVKTAVTSQEEECTARRPPDASPSNSAACQKDLEAFRHSSNSYSLHQMQVMKSIATDPSHRESKRLKGLENGEDVPDIAAKAAQTFSGGASNTDTDPLVSRTSVSAGDAKMLSFSSQPGNGNTSQFPHGNVSSKDKLSFGCSDPQKITSGNNITRVEHAGISLRMAPSWFEQYGTFKNGHLLPAHNLPTIPMIKNMEPQFLSGKSPSNLVVHNSAEMANAVVDIIQVANTCQTTNVPSENVSFMCEFTHAPSLANVRPKKRKTASSDSLSWNKEIGQRLKRLQSMSSAEVDWARSSNHLVEKVEDEIENSEDLLPVIRPKRRLILTTHLMQQVFHPPSAAVLSRDAGSNYEIVAYSLTRVGLGDACSLIRCLESESPVNLDSGDLKVKTTERIRDQYFSKVVEDFMTRAKELENGLSRLDKRASILDFRLDCQDLERFSVINRFARFHGRGQIDGAETSSSSDATVTARPCPQRYVSAHPMPRTVPERVQCLSL